MNEHSTAISFVFKQLGAVAVTDYEKLHQQCIFYIEIINHFYLYSLFSDNFKAILHLVHRKERAGKIIKELDYISNSSTFYNVGS